MEKTIEDSQEQYETTQISAEKKKHYSEPNLVSLGSVQKVTLGGSTTIPDSGGGPGVP